MRSRLKRYFVFDFWSDVGIQGEITVFLPLLLLLLLLILRVFFSKLLISFALLFDHIHFVKRISQIFYFHPQIFF